MISKIFKYIVKIFVYLIFLYPLYFISHFIPRKKNLWLFGSHNNTFSDNSKYLFYYVTENHPEIEAVWITGNENVMNKLKSLGYKVLKRWSFNGIWKTLRGKFFIFSAYSSDINFWTSGGAIKFNLWHGIPLKKIEYDVKVGKLGKKYNSFLTPIYKFFFPNSFQKPDYFLSTSPLVTKIFSQAFRIKPEQCLEFGYPRCDHFFWNREKNIEFIKAKEPEILLILDKIKKYKKVIIYMPTFREGSTNNLEEIIDMESLNDFMVKNSYILLIKQHPNIKSSLNKEYSNLLFLDSSLDVYLILPFTDLLITDYSSIMFDYMLLKKPIILFTYDEESYMNQERGFYFDFGNFVKEFNIEKVINEDELIEKIEKFFGSSDNSISYVKLNKLYKFADASSSGRIVKFLVGKINK